MASTSIDGHRIGRALLRSFSPLDSLKTDSLRAVEEKTQLRKFSQGQALFNKGDIATNTYFLVSGTVELSHDGHVINTIRASTPEARFPVGSGAIHHFRAQAISGRVECLVVDSAELDVLLTWDQTGCYQVADLHATQGDAPESDDWMVRLLQSRAFQRIPPANIQTMFMRLQRVDYKAGETVVKQGSEGDYFYAIVNGRCIVQRDMPLKGEKQRLGELGMGDTFGEEALIADSRRNASVAMLTDGTLMRLTKEDFQTLCNEPMLDWIDADGARNMIAAGGKWLDVRLPSEVEHFGIGDAVNIPLYYLRTKLSTLDPQVPYVLCCDTGRRSSVAAYILGQKGLRVQVLRGGLTAWPALARPRRVVSPIKSVASELLQVGIGK